MKYNGYINYKKCEEWGLTLPQAVLVDLFSILPLWADKKVIEEEIWYFFSKNKILEELPILSKSGKVDTVYRKAKELEALGLIESKKIGIKDFWRIPNKLKEWQFSEKNPTLLEKKSEPSSEKNPTYNNTNINNNTKNNILERYKSIILTDRKKSTKGSQMKLFIEQLLKEYSEDELLRSISNYEKSTDIKFRMSGHYFFANSKSPNCKYYRPFEDYLGNGEESEKVIEKKPINFDNLF